MVKSKRIPPGTEVLIYTKSRGCAIQKVLRRLRRYKDESINLPITGWVTSSDYYELDEYVLTYRIGDNQNGDFYNRGDFKLHKEEEMFEDGDFLI